MGLGFVNTDYFHDLLVRTVNLYWTEVSSLIFLQPQANGLPPLANSEFMQPKQMIVISHFWLDF
jgi:hypothetical protein